MGKAISKPLKDAASTIRYYSDKDTALNLRLPTKGNDEIAQLGKALNHLADNLDANLRELDQSKKYQETLFQLSPIPIIIANTLGEIEGANESASSFFGVEHHILSQMNLERFFQQDDLNAIFNRIIQDMQDIPGFVTTIKMTDGSKKVVELNVASYQDDFNHIKNIIVAIIDITEKIDIQREILHNQTKLQRINNELTQKTDELQRLSSWNKKNAHNLAQLIDISQEMMRAAEPNEILTKIVEKGLKLLEADECVIYLRKKSDNALIPSLASPENVLNRVAPVVLDSNNFLWKTYRENEPFVFDLDEMKMAEIRLFGLKPDTPFSLIAVPVSEKDYHFGVIVFLKYQYHAFRVEDVHLLSTLANQAAILLDNIHLVHALKEKAESLEHALNQLQKSQQQVVQLQKMESLGTLVGGIAHDFNNILGIVIPNADLIRNDVQGNPKIVRRINIIAEAAQRAADLTRQLLMFSRNQDIQVKTISPNRLIVRLAKMFRRTLGKEYEINLDLNPDVKFVEADETRLSQVLINLAVNARDAMPGGGEITIRTDMIMHKPRTSQTTEKREFVCISISDTGRGIKAGDFDKIFDPFFTTKTMGKGTGLGLSVVYGIIQSHKGFVDVESKVGKGTTFYLYLPPSLNTVEAVKEVAPKYIPRGTENILIVDDEQMILQSGKEILEAMGYSVTTAAGGPQALDILQQNKRRYQLAIVDMSMPKMNGIQTIRKIRELDSAVNILLSTGHVDKEKTIPKDLKIEGMLPKPYRVREMALKVRQVLSVKSI